MKKLEMMKRVKGCLYAACKDKRRHSIDRETPSHIRVSFDMEKDARLFMRLVRYSYYIDAEVLRFTDQSVGYCNTIIRRVRPYCVDVVLSSSEPTQVEAA